jgi:hypothetical protein
MNEESLSPETAPLKNLSLAAAAGAKQSPANKTKQGKLHLSV